jgi:hypothetical protein
MSWFTFFFFFLMTFASLGFCTIKGPSYYSSEPFDWVSESLRRYSVVMTPVGKLTFSKCLFSNSLISSLTFRMRSLN